MSLTPSNMLPLGTHAPDFSLLDTVSGDTISLSAVASDHATVVMFICNHCPYVVHIIEQLVNVIKTYQGKGVSFVAISSNDVENYPQDAPDKMAQYAHQQGFTFPYLYDATQAVAKAYDAACTPDFYVFDRNLQCAYRGRFDAATPGNDKPVTGQDLTQALDVILSGKSVPEDQQVPSMGCNIKWC